MNPPHNSGVPSSGTILGAKSLSDREKGITDENMTKLEPTVY
jgi:hypothetical protein